MSLAPILLYPAFRYGAATLWGGDQLKTRYGKPTPDTRTGESLEMSVIPGLNSTDAQGTPLSELLARYGAQLTGTQITGEFPLLLKLLDAKQALSVQVHPDDAYAQAYENKLGKTEAWIILAAEPGAHAVQQRGQGHGRDPAHAAVKDVRTVRFRAENARYGRKKLQSEPVGKAAGRAVEVGVHGDHADAAAHQRLHRVAAHAADAEHGCVGVVQPLHAILT